MVVGDDDDNKMPLKDRTCNDEDTDLNMTAETRLEQRRENILKWMKRLTIVLIILIGVFLLGYMFWNLTFSDNNEPKLVEDVHIESLNDGNMGTVREASLLPAMTTLAPVTTLKPRIEETAAKDEIDITTTAPLIPSWETFQSKLGVYDKAAICSDSEICSTVGSDIFKRGGNAIDSTLAVLLCNGLTTMQSMGIGGGFIMNIFIKKDNRAYTIDAREVAPFAAHESMFVNKSPRASLSTPEAIAVPGEVMGYYSAHSRFGSMSWKQIIEPSIKICNEGFIMSEHQYESLNIQPSVLNDTHLRSAFINNATGKFHLIGTKIMPHRELCQTYANLAENGPLDFYNGSIAKDVAADLKDLGSIVTADDLEAYNADFVSSISMPLGKDTLYATPPVGSGTVVAHILSILNGFNITSESLANDTEKALFLHRMAEAFKFGFAKRWELGDLRFNDLRELVSQLTSTDFGDELRQEINDSSTADDSAFYGARFSAKDEYGTSHISVLAPNGDAVSVTSSVNHYFGSGFTGKRTGIVFNSGMDDFSTPGTLNQFQLPAAPSNFIEPQKRAMSSMSPMILTNSTGHVKLVIGSAGGSKIITAVAQIIARVVWFGEDIKTAIDAPRIHHQLVPNVLTYEKGSLESLMKLLDAKGHKTKEFEGRGSAMCGIVQNRTAIYANADFRKGGGIDGF